MITVDDFIMSISEKKKTGLLDYRNIPDQSGKIFIVTGANSGIGFEATRVFLQKNARVIMACRNREKAGKALSVLKDENPGAIVEVMELDMARLDSVKRFAGEFRSKYDTLDVLVNNAGIMATPYKLTTDGFEMQFGTNHLGHFLLTGLLLDILMGTAGSRVVTISSIAHFNGTINFDDINSTKDYSRMKSYRQSKLANLLFTYELDRKLKQAESSTISLAVHPGISSTNLISLPPFLKRLEDMLLMTPAKGALPTVTGATDRSFSGSEYIGPAGFRQAYGFPALLLSGRNSYDKETSARLWSLSEEMTGFKYNF